MGCGASHEGSVAEYTLPTAAAPLYSHAPQGTGARTTAVPAAPQQGGGVGAALGRTPQAPTAVKRSFMRGGKFSARDLKQKPREGNAKADSAAGVAAAASVAKVLLSRAKKPPQEEGLSIKERVSDPAAVDAKDGRRLPVTAAAARTSARELAAAHLPAETLPPPASLILLTSSLDGDEDHFAEMYPMVLCEDSSSSVSPGMRAQLAEAAAGSGRHSPSVDLLHTLATTDAQMVGGSRAPRLSSPTHTASLSGEDYGNVHLLGNGSRLHSTALRARPQLLSSASQRHSSLPLEQDVNCANPASPHGCDMAFFTCSSDSGLAPQSHLPDLTSKASNVLSCSLMSNVTAPMSDSESSYSEGSIWGHLSSSSRVSHRAESTGCSSLTILTALHSSAPTLSGRSSVYNASGLNSFFISGKEGEEDADVDLQVRTSLTGSMYSKEPGSKSAGGANGSVEEGPTETKEEEEEGGDWMSSMMAAAAALPPTQRNRWFGGSSRNTSCSGSGGSLKTPSHTTSVLSDASVHLLTTVKGRRRVVTIVEPPRRPSPIPRPTSVMTMRPHTAPPPAQASSTLPQWRGAAAVRQGQPLQLPSPHAPPSTISKALVRPLAQRVPQLPQTLPNAAHFH